MNVVAPVENDENAAEAENGGAGMGVGVGEGEGGGDDGIFNPTSLLPYFQSLDTTTFDKNAEEAINIIIDRLTNDSAAARAVGLPDLFTAPKKPVRKEVIRLLVNRIPVQFRHNSGLSTEHTKFFAQNLPVESIPTPP